MQYHAPHGKQGRVVTNKDAILYQLGKHREFCAMRVMGRQKRYESEQTNTQRGKKGNVPRRGLKKEGKTRDDYTVRCALKVS